MSRPFSILKAEAGRKVSDTSTSVATKLGEAMNRKYHELWRLYNWVETTVINESFTITAGVTQQTLPGDIAIILAITERANDILLKPSSPYVYSMKYIADVSSTNLPLAYTPSGYTMLQTQLTANGILKVVSDSASDTGTVRIWGLNSASVYVSEQITLNGVTPVSGTVTWLAGGVDKIVKSALTVGTITVKDSADTELMTIAPRDYNNKYLRIDLQSPPDKGYTGYICGKKPFKGLEYDEDIPDFDCCDALVHYGAGEYLKIKGKYKQGMVEEAQGDRIITALVTEKEVMDETGDSTLPTVAVNEIDKPIFAG